MRAILSVSLLIAGLTAAIVSGASEDRVCTRIEGESPICVSLTTPTAIFASAGNVCILKGTGNVDCDGSNPGSADYLKGDAVSVGMGLIRTCVITRLGNLECWGEHGYGDVQSYTGGDAVAVSGGQFHTCFLKQNGMVDCSGWNYYGQAADYVNGDAVAVSAGSEHTCVLLQSGNVTCFGRNHVGQGAGYGGGDAVALSAGGYHTCVLTTAGNVDCWGHNWAGQADDYVNGDAVAVATSAFATCVVTSAGNVDCYGDNGEGQSEDYTGGDAVAVAPARYATCVLRLGGIVDCYGEKGRGDYVGAPNCDRYNDAALTNHCLLPSSRSQEVPVPVVEPPIVTPGPTLPPACVLGTVCTGPRPGVPTVTPPSVTLSQTEVEHPYFIGYVELTAACGRGAECRLVP